MGRHYLETEHQESVLSFTNQNLIRLHGESGNSTSKSDINEQHQQIAVECLQRVESVLQEISPVNDDCVELNSKREMMETRIRKTREDLRKLNEVSVSCIKLLELIQQMFAEMKELINEIQTKYMTSPTLLDDNDTYTMKFNVLPY